MSAQEHGFKAEVQQLLDLMIHSVYSEREVFVRELVSNAADALDKARFLGLTRTDLVPAAPGEPGIRITLDPEARRLVLEDDGVGMTREEVIENLGTIARSGSKEFLDRLREAGQDAPKLIGQFGVGFYSCFMAADEVEVITRSALPEGTAVRWHSFGAGKFSVEDAEREVRGTRITISLREDAKEFAEEDTVRAIVRRHSNYLPWPVHVGATQANEARALWAEPPSKVTDEEATTFYKNVAMDWREPAFKIHVSVDSPIQYHALLFVPKDRPYDLFDPRVERGPRLYARRVMITEHATDLLPDWLRFVRGVVDSEDLPLNVSREMIQKTPVVRKIRENLTKRILKDLGKLAEEHGNAGVTNEWPTIWREFGFLLKEGHYASPEHRDLLLPLLRFNALSHDDERGMLSLAGYKAAMKEGQDTIWFLTAETRAAALASPHLEAFKARGWDVLLLVDPVDEWLVSGLDKFDDLPLKSITRGELDLGDKDENKTDLIEVGAWMAGLFGEAVKGVRASARLTDSACVLVDDDSGMTANMERILRSAQQKGPAAKRILELNPAHPLILNLARMKEKGLEAEAEPVARLLLDDAMLREGSVKDPAAVARRLQDLLEHVTMKALA